LGPEPSAAQRHDAANLPNVILHHKPYALEWMPESAEDVRRSGEWLLELAETSKPDIVHLNGYAHASLPFRVPALLTAHSCVRSWWRAVHQCPPGPEWDAYREGVQRGLDNAASVIAPSKAMASALEREYAVAREKITVIHNFSEVPESPKTQKEPRIAAAGRIWDESKNIRLLANIAPECDWPIEVAGSAIAGSAQKPKPDRGSDNFLLLGELSHAALLARLQKVSIFAHPALYEPFGLAVLEAARCSCCLVLSSIESLCELWDGCAQFCDPRDPEQWRFELNRLAANPKEREMLVARSLRRSRQYQPESSIRAYLAEYRRLLKDRFQNSETVKEAAA
jgi:glycosyltransferase involved in cell wall biosynthesis